MERRVGHLFLLWHLPHRSSEKLGEVVDDVRDEVARELLPVVTAGNFLTVFRPSANSAILHHLRGLGYPLLVLLLRLLAEGHPAEGAADLVHLLGAANVVCLAVLPRRWHPQRHQLVPRGHSAEAPCRPARCAAPSQSAPHS